MTRKRKKWLFWTGGILGAIVLVGLCTVLALSVYVKQQTKDRIYSRETFDQSGYDCILVFGAGVREDGSLSPLLQDRVQTGIDLYFQGAAPKLLMSGDHGREDYNEPDAMKSYAVAQGVPSSDIFVDYAGFSTYESLVRAKQVFGAKRVLLVTQTYHLYRALYIGEQLGMDCDGVESDCRTYQSQWWWNLREIVARAKDVCYTAFHVPIEETQQTIALNTDGDLAKGEVPS